MKNLLFFIIIFIHFTLIKIGEFEITIGYLLLLLSPFFIFSRVKFNINLLFLFLLYLTYDFIKLIFESHLNVQIVDFIKSQTQIFILILYISIFKSSQLKEKFSSDLVSQLRIVGIFILISILLQGIGFFFFNNIFSNFFGEFQWKYNLVSEVFRAKSFFLEPSFLALVLNILLFGDLILKKKNGLIDLYRISIVLGIIATASLFGLVLSMIMFTLYNKLFFKNKSSKYLLILIIPSLFLLTLFGFFNRFRELTVVNTSGYERIIYPILLLGFMISNLRYYFGIPINGDFNLSILASGDILVLNETVQNAFLLLIINFGLLFIPLFLFYLYKITASINTNLKFYLLLFPIFLFNSGGLYALFYSFFTILLPILILKAKGKNANIAY